MTFLKLRVKELSFCGCDKILTKKKVAPDNINVGDFFQL